MFDMTSQQQQAFSDATNGVSAYLFSHLILFTIGALATIWLFFIVLGTWHEMRTHEVDVGAAMAKIAFAVFVYIAVGSMIYFS